VTKLQPCWNKWITPDVWVNIVNDRHDTPDDLKFSSTELNVAVSRNPQHESNLIETTSIVNPMGLCKAWRFDEKKKTVVCCAASPNTLPTVPGGNSKWCCDMASLLPTDTRSAATTAAEDKQGDTTSAQTSNKKKRRAVTNRNGALRNGATGYFLAMDDPERAVKQARPSTRSNPQQETPLEEMIQSSAPVSWWDSTNAFSLFAERRFDDDDDDANDEEDVWNVKAMIEKRIERLRGGHTVMWMDGNLL
jgi:hypothetical protein